MLREKIRKFYGNHEPVLSYVSQPPLNTGLILEVHSYKADEDDHITFRRHGGFHMSYWKMPMAVSSLPVASMGM